MKRALALSHRCPMMGLTLSGSGPAADNSASGVIRFYALIVHLAEQLRGPIWLGDEAAVVGNLSAAGALWPEVMTNRTWGQRA